MALKALFLFATSWLMSCALSKPYPEWTQSHDIHDQWAHITYNRNRQIETNPSDDSNQHRHHLGFHKPDLILTSLKVNPKIPAEIRQRFFEQADEENETNLPWEMDKNEPVHSRYSSGRVRDLKTTKLPIKSNNGGKTENFISELELQKVALTKRNSRRHQKRKVCLQRLVRNIMRQTCKQYINLKRLNLIKHNRLDLNDYQVSKQMKNCLILFGINN